MKDRASTPREDVHSAKTMHANSYANYASSSPYFIDQTDQTSHNTVDLNANINISPNFQSDRGIFSDILSSTGKVLSTVTVDTIHSSTVCDITDVPYTDDIDAIEDDALYSDRVTPKTICDTLRTETYTNEDILRIKLEPTLTEFDDYLQGRFTPNNNLLKCLTPTLISHKTDYKTSSSKNTPDIFYKDYENNSGIIYKSDIVVEESSTLPQVMVNESHYLVKTILHDFSALNNAEETREVFTKNVDVKNENVVEVAKPAYVNQDSPVVNHVDLEPVNNLVKIQPPQSKMNKLKTLILNLPIHYHAAIICFLLVMYNVLINIYVQHKMNNSNKL